MNTAVRSLDLALFLVIFHWPLGQLVRGQGGKEKLVKQCKEIGCQVCKDLPEVGC
jgi:hypothetical protein